MHESRLMGGVQRALVVVGAVFGVALLSAGVASAADPVQLKSRLGNWCLDGPNSNAATMVNPCDGSKSQQAWQQFRKQLIPLLDDAYPARPDGRTFFPFRRVFVVAQVG